MLVRRCDDRSGDHIHIEMKRRQRRRTKRKMRRRSECGHSRPRHHPRAMTTHRNMNQVRMMINSNACADENEMTLFVKRFGKS